jgi:hypothetical protein
MASLGLLNERYQAGILELGIVYLKYDPNFIEDGDEDMMSDDDDDEG